MKLALFEIIDKLPEIKSRKGKVEWLKQNESPTLKRFLKYMYCPSVKFNVPDSEPPYTPSIRKDNHTALFNEYRRLNIFTVGGGYDHLKPVKREGVFIGILEHVHAQDAELLVQMICKQKIRGLTKKTINEAFPELIED